MLVSSFLEGEKTVSTFQSYLNDYRVYVKDYTLASKCHALKVLKFLLIISSYKTIFKDNINLVVQSFI